MTTQTKDERIKRQIKDAAKGLFQKWGLQKTTMEDIAKASAKGKSTLYYYFKSKDEIFGEIASEELEAILRQAQAAMQRETSAEGRLRAYLLCTVEEARQQATVYDIVFGEISQYEDVMNSLRKQHDEEERQLISEILAEGVASGEFAPFTEVEIRQLSSLLVLTFRTLIFDYAMRQAFDEVTVMVKFALSVFVHGLRP